MAKSKGNTAQWERRASADLLPQSCSMKNGKYIQYSHIFHTFARVKISRRITLPHYAVLPKKWILIVLPLLVLAGLALFQFDSNQEGFTGSRVKNPDAYLLDIQRMNGTDLHTLELREGDVLQIQFETEKGNLYMEIKAPDGTSLYRGNGKETTSFTVNIRESGVYAIVVEARHAKGTIHVWLAGDNR